MKYQIHRFVQSLTFEPLTTNVFNPYGLNADGQLNQANWTRRENLKLYLNQMAELSPRLFLVGEAPGYRGCRRTGVPFTSEPILLAGITWKICQKQNSTAIYTLFGVDAGYRRAVDFQEAVAEATATIMWQSIAQVWPPPLLWNAFPFHPHRKGHPQSNRAPLKSELKFGQEFLQSLLEMFQIDQVVAVGKKAACALELAGIPRISLRHPSHGGKVAFQEGLQDLIGSP
jgi:uracil-DNA glycosylase